ncbi:MAG: sugar ABC transporter permease, partial [Armatimonadetes bacterium]|nr:sugar ABC transporter permease [Armatimonadota bacterium]
MSRLTRSAAPEHRPEDAPTNIEAKAAARFLAPRSAWHRRSRRLEALGALAFLLPAGVILLTFHILPIFYAFYISLHEWGLVREEFVGLEHYRTLIGDSDFRQSLMVTVWFVLGTVPLGIALSLVIALLLFGELRARGFFRTVYFLPYITSVVAAALAWSWIYNPQYGILNFVLERGGLPAQRWLLDPTGVFQLLLGGAGANLPGWAQGPSLALVSIIATSAPASWRNS